MLTRFLTRRKLDLDPPEKSTPLAKVEFLAVDFETTGFDSSRDRIVSMGWVPVRGQLIALGLSGYHVIRGVEVGESATIHGITHDESAHGTPLADALDALLAALHGRVLLAHFASIEADFLDAACLGMRGELPTLTIADTFALERRRMERTGAVPRGEDLRLARVRERYDLPRYGSHNALSDALACGELFLAQQSHMNAVKLGAVITERRF